MTLLDATLAFVVVIVWAVNFIAAKIGVEQLPPLLMTGMRFALVALLLSPFLKPQGGRWGLIVALSTVFGIFHFGPLFVGISGIDASLAAIAIQLTIPFSAILAAIVFGEKMGIRQIAGVAVAFGGVYLLTGGDGTAAAPSLPHFMLVVFAAFAWSVANILIKRLGRISPFTLNAWIALLAAPQLFLASAILESGQGSAVATADWRAWAAIAYMAVGASITAYGLWYYLVRKYDLNRIVPLTLLSPVLAVGIAAALLDEPLTARIVLGGVLTIAGVAMIQFLRPPPSAAPPPTPPPGRADG
jgi:O-acetylserine/cysteine efflux transporter